MYMYMHALNESIMGVESGGWATCLWLYQLLVRRVRRSPTTVSFPKLRSSQTANITFYMISSFGAKSMRTHWRNALVEQTVFDKRARKSRIYSYHTMAMVPAI